MKALIHTNRYLSKPTIRGKILIRNASASAKIEGVVNARNRILQILRRGVIRYALKRA